MSLLVSLKSFINCFFYRCKFLLTITILCSDGAFNGKLNETASYHRHSFHLHILVRKLFWKKAFLFRILSLFAIISKLLPLKTCNLKNSFQELLWSEKVSLFTNSGYWRKMFSPFCQKLFDGGVTTAFDVCRETVWREVFALKKLFFFIQFRMLSEKCLTSLPFLLGKAVRTSVYVSIGTLWAEFCSKNTIIFLSISDIEWKIFNFRKFILAVLSNWHFMCPEEHFEEIFFFRENIIFFIFFRCWAKKNLTFCQKSFRGDVKTAFYVSIGTFWGKIFVSKKVMFFHQLGILSE